MKIVNAEFFNPRDILVIGLLFMVAIYLFALIDPWLTTTVE